MESWHSVWCFPSWTEGNHTCLTVGVELWPGVEPPIEDQEVLVTTLTFFPYSSTFE